MLLSHATEYLVLSIYPLSVSATGSCHLQAKICQTDITEVSHCDSLKTGLQMCSYLPKLICFSCGDDFSIHLSGPRAIWVR